MATWVNEIGSRQTLETLAKLYISGLENTAPSTHIKLLLFPSNHIELQLCIQLQLDIEVQLDIEIQLEIEL
jgi:hypothetical protein